jgi:hypothetical protein
MSVVGAEKVSAHTLSPLSLPVAASSGIVMTDLSGSLARDAKTGVGCRCCKPLGRASVIEGNGSKISREACRLEDAVFSRTPNCVGRDFIYLSRGLCGSPSFDLLVILAVGVLP